MTSIVIPNIPFYLSNGIIKEFKEDLEAKDTHTSLLNNCFDEIYDKERMIHEQVTTNLIYNLRICYESIQLYKENLDDDVYLHMLHNDISESIQEIETSYYLRGEDFFYRSTYHYGYECYEELMDFIAVSPDIIDNLIELYQDKHQAMLYNDEELPDVYDQYWNGEEQEKYDDEEKVLSFAETIYGE